MVLTSLFRCVPKFGQVVRLRVDVKSGCMNNNRRITYLMFRIRGKDNKPVGLALTQTEFDEFSDRGRAMLNQVPGPLEIGKYYESRLFVTRNNIRTDKVPLTIMRLYQHKTKTSIEEFILALNPKQIRQAIDRFNNNEQIRWRFCWWRRFLRALVS